MDKIMNTKISVVMSVYNGETYLHETIDSILNQTFRDFELILINDGSSDNTLLIFEEFKKKDERIRIINNVKNIGFIKSLNKGLKASKGKYIARMDPDDICMPERFEKQYDFLEKNKDIFLVGTFAINIDEHGNKLSLFKPPMSHELIAKTLPRRNCMYHNTIMFRNTGEIWYREKMMYTEDNDFYLNCLTSNKRLANIPVYLVKYRRMADSVSFSKKGKQILFSEKAREFYRQRVKWGKDEYDSFDPQSILNLDLNNVNNPLVLKAEINAYFAVNNRLKVRDLSKKYLKKYGFLTNPKTILYYLSSFMNTKLLNFMKKIILILKNKY
jgi:glycosyltransferase involved in cell wall biosynthesis